MEVVFKKSFWVRFEFKLVIASFMLVAFSVCFCSFTLFELFSVLVVAVPCSCGPVEGCNEDRLGVLETSGEKEVAFLPVVILDVL